MLLNCFLTLLAGVGVFIAGMNMLGDGLEKSAGKGMKRLLGKISDNRFAGVGVGAAVTAIIQSSSATSVMAIGFVNAGIMTLTQAAAIIMGANIGTTVTGILVSLSSLDIDIYAMAFAFVGVMMTFFKSEKVKNIGGILCGFGLLFIGLDIMSSENAFGNDRIKSLFESIFVKIDFPLLLILCGVIFTGLIQSSSAATGLVIIMVGQGALSVENALFIVLGSNIGTCVTAVLASIGTQVNAKRTAMMHLTFNVAGTVLFTAVLWPLSGKVVAILQSLIPDLGMQIAWFHVIFNVTTTLVLLPFIKWLVKFATFVIKDKQPSCECRQLKYVDDRILKTPAIAMMQVKKEVEYMATLARENIEKSFASILEGTKEYDEFVRENEAIIDFTNSAVSKYLIKLSGLVNEGDEQAIGAYFHVLNDLERIGDHAENFHEIGVELQEAGTPFSAAAIAELKDMHAKIMRMFEIAAEAFDNGNSAHLGELTILENEVDGLKKSLSANHFARLADGNCNVELSAYFISTVSGLERVADHLINFGYSILNPTGSQSQAKLEACKA